MTTVTQQIRLTATRGEPHFLRSLFIGLLESSHWALSFQPLTFKKFEKFNTQRKNIYKITKVLLWYIEFHDAPDKWMEDDKAMEVCSIWKPYTTHYQCIECSLKFGTNQYFCNYFSLSAVQNCHNLYHKQEVLWKEAWWQQ